MSDVPMHDAEVLARLERRAARERSARLEAERIAEIQLRRAYERSREVELLAAIAVIVNDASDALGALSAAAKVIRKHCGFAVSHVLVPDDDGAFVTADIWDADPDQLEFLDVVLTATADERFLPPRGLPGEVASSHLAAWLPDLTVVPNHPRSPVLRGGAAWAFPVVTGVEVLSVIEFVHPSPRGADERLLQLAPSLGAQLGRSFEWERAQQRQEFDRRRLEELVAQRTQENAELRRQVRTAGEARSALSAALAHAAAVAARHLPDATDELGAALERLVAVVDGVPRSAQPGYGTAAPRAVLDVVVRATAGDAAQVVADDSGGVEGPDVDADLAGRALRALVDYVVLRAGASRVTLGVAVESAAVVFEVRHDGAADRPRPATPPTGPGELAQAARLATALGGELTFVDASPDGGVARLRVPAADHVPTSSVPGRAVSPSSRVLLVDDNEINRRLAAAMLGRIGVDTDVVDGALAAHDAMRATAYGLVLMDIQMPDVDGREATRRWRADASGATARDVPVVALTAHVGEAERDACTAAGMDDYLSKPFGLDGLTEVVRRWLDRAQPPVESR